MKNKLDIDKYMQEYKESLPPVSHTKDEENALFNSIIMKTEAAKLSDRKIYTKSKYGFLLDFMNTLFQKNSFRYSVGFAVLCMIVGVWVISIDTPKNQYISSNTTNNKKILESNTPESKTNEVESKIDARTIASIDIDSYSRGGENIVDKKTTFGIIGKQLSASNIKYNVDKVLTTQKINTDSGSIVLQFKYQQSSKSVKVIGITQSPDTSKNISIDVKSLVKKIKTDVEDKAQNLRE